MSVTGKLETKIQECRETITRLERDADQASKAVEQATKALHGIERKIEDAQVEVRAFEEALRLVQSAERKSALNSAPARTISLRPGTTVAKVRDTIREAGKALHINEIMERMGQPGDHKARVSLVGSLTKYVTKGQIFKRTAPNTFDLKDSQPAETLAIARAVENPQDQDDMR